MFSNSGITSGELQQGCLDVCEYQAQLRDIFTEIETAFSLGGKVISCIRDNNEPLWWILVQDEKRNVYWGYTVKEKNKGFFFDLLEYCYTRGYALIIRRDARDEDNR